MRKLLWGFAVVFTASMIILACQKEASSPQDVNAKFDDKAAKEWYYGTFKKSAEWKNSSTKGKQLPDWKKGVYKKIGNFEIVEFPLVKQNRSIVMNENGSEQEKRKIAENTLDRIAFVKSNSGKIFVRGVQFIPDITYLANNNYDISKNTLGDIDTKFSGVLSIRTWNNKEIVRNNLKAGKVTARSYPLSSTKILRGSRIECDGVLVTEWSSDCEVHITGSNADVLITVDCTPWAPTGNQWCLENPQNPACANPASVECFCELIGGCQDNSGIIGECSQESADNAANGLSEMSLNTKVEIETTNQNSTSITRKYKWLFYSVIPGIGSGVYFKSTETGVQEKGADGWWRWTSFVHTGETQSGGGNLWDAVVNSLTATPFMTNIELGGPVNVTVSIAGMQLDFVIKITYSCGLFTATRYPNDVATNSWYTHEQ